MGKRIAIGLVVILLIIFSVLILFRANEDTWICDNGQWVKHGNPKSPMPTKKCVDKAPTVTQKSENISLDSPKANAKVSITFVVKGSARVFENQLNYRILDSKGNKVLEGSVYADAKDAGQFGPYEITVSGLTLKEKITLEVFDYSAKDGSEIDKVVIPLTLQ